MSKTLFIGLLNDASSAVVQPSGYCREPAGLDQRRPGVPTATWVGLAGRSYWRLARAIASRNWRLLLAEFGRTNQVLLFSHHRSVRDLAMPLATQGLANIVSFEEAGTQLNRANSATASLAA